MSHPHHMGEDELISHLLEHVPLAKARAAPGDDCAAIDRDSASPELQLLKTDALVSGIHFLEKEDAYKVGWKAAARVVSDLAAMGGTPEHFLVTLAIPATVEVDWLEQLYQGIGQCLRVHHATVTGGETTRVPDGSATVISIAATGRVKREHLTLRSGGIAGDALFVTGTLGGSLAGKHLDFIPRMNEALWLVEHHKPSAMMDLSDGLAKDLPRLAASSGCGFHIETQHLPVTAGCSTKQALNDGEDYELLFAISIDAAERLERAWPQAFPHLALTRIGTLCPIGEGNQLHGGWDHFRPLTP